MTTRTANKLYGNSIGLPWARPRFPLLSLFYVWTFGAVLSALRDKIAGQPVRRAPRLSTRPQLQAPLLPPPGSYRPALYFAKGALDNDPKKNPTPILYLLMETRETALPRPVPGNPLLLRSICKGKGVLKKNKQGMIYLDIDNRFITAMIPFLKAYGLVRPPYFNLFGNAPDGAHIPVITHRETTFHYIGDLPELGQEFSFEIEGLYSIEPTLWPEVEQVWFFQIRSPELEALRRRAFLVPTPGCHPFHIAVAIKPRLTVATAPYPLPIMRVNSAYCAA